MFLATFAPPSPLQPDPDWELNPYRLYAALIFASVQWDSHLRSILLRQSFDPEPGALGSMPFPPLAVEPGRQRGGKHSHTSRNISGPASAGVGSVVGSRLLKFLKPRPYPASGRVNDCPTFIRCRLFACQFNIEHMIVQYCSLDFMRVKRQVGAGLRARCLSSAVPVGGDGQKGALDSPARCSRQRRTSWES